MHFEYNDRVAPEEILQLFNSYREKENGEETKGEDTQEKAEGSKGGGSIDSHLKDQEKHFNTMHKSYFPQEKDRFVVLE